MAVHVQLMPPALRKLDPALHDRVRSELALVFPQAETVNAYDVLQGFHSDQHKKVILAVQTQSPRANSSQCAFGMHVVKLGERQEVADDALGWQQCVPGRQMSQRMFVPVHLQDLPDAPNRAAVVYQDASQWYGLLTAQEEVATLAWAIDKAVFGEEIEVAAVERVMRQVLRELGRSFYRDAAEDPVAARKFYRSKLKLDTDETTVQQWKQGELWLLRRDVDWLLCGPISPAGDTLPGYIDPYDYVRWVLESGHLPAALIGPSHGDLHAFNIIVGVAGSDVEYPLLIDYGDMALDNVVAWDFAKLETELKVRLLARLFDHPATRQTVWNQVRSRHFQRLVQRWNQGDHSHLDPLVDRTQQIVFAFEFERRLAERTEHIFHSPRQGDTQTTATQSALERALSILLTIRCQAAEHLGRRGQRSRCWRDEYDLALAVYGLNTVKFPDRAYPLFQRLFALLSAGTAVSRLAAVRAALNPAVDQPQVAPEASPIYHVPLRQAYRQRKANDRLDAAERLLASVSGRFDYAIPLLREHALLLSKIGRPDEARQMLENIARPQAAEPPRETHAKAGLAALCESFLETEVLSRIGRICKDKADAHWERLNIPFPELHNQTPALYYRSAQSFYHRAFQLTLDYYPGGKAAVTGLLAREPSATDIARAVARECEMQDLGALSAVDRYWVLATEGDMVLILKQSQRAASFYQAAIEELPEGNDGMVQTTYAQLCRLYKALGEELLRPALDVFRSTTKFALKAGPLGDCGGLFQDTTDPSGS